MQKVSTYELWMRVNPADCYHWVRDLCFKELHFISHTALILLAFLSGDDQGVNDINSVLFDTSQDGASFNLVVGVRVGDPQEVGDDFYWADYAAQLWCYWLCWGLWGSITSIRRWKSVNIIGIHRGAAIISIKSWVAATIRPSGARIADGVGDDWAATIETRVGASSRVVIERRIPGSLTIRGLWTRLPLVGDWIICAQSWDVWGIAGLVGSLDQGFVSLLGTFHLLHQRGDLGSNRLVLELERVQFAYIIFCRELEPLVKDAQGLGISLVLLVKHVNFDLHLHELPPDSRGCHLVWEGCFFGLAVDFLFQERLTALHIY